MSAPDFATHQLFQNALLVTGPRPFRILSSSLHGGGWQTKRHLLNLQVPHGYICDDPLQDVAARIDELGLPRADTAAMMTAADVEDFVEGYASGDQFALKSYITAGISNAARAGQCGPTYPGYRAGTINAILVLDARLTPAAMVNAIITITEAKAAALQELAIRDAQGRLATGTTTDSILLACTQSERYRGVHHYAGVATEIGCAIGQTVYETLLAGLRGQRGKGAIYGG
ncbi:MAG TPA: adenosylcobinamide amidohydrolase [Bacilli bacterium]|nr:adenosylcobinamide amidohydrolase [Bacilli bacterium]